MSELYTERFFIPLWSETHQDKDPNETFIAIELGEIALSNNIILGQE